MENYSFPDTIALMPNLQKIFPGDAGTVEIVDLLSRKPFLNSSTFPVEIISCRLSNGQVIKLFCKYLGNHFQYSFGHRGGVEYEAIVYKEVLSKLSLPVAKFYGICNDRNAGSWLALEYLEDSIVVKDFPEPEYFSKAATWIGTLHRLFENRLIPDIKIYDNNYYTFWVNRVRALAEHFKTEYSWLSEVCTYFQDNLNLLSAVPPTFIHGEYYPKNILIKNAVIYPTDWESAAIGPSEIDVASLIEGWGKKIKNISLNSYLTARWPDGNFRKREFEERLLLARIYFFLRWTGEYDDPGVWANRSKWFKKFHLLAKQAGCK